MRRKRQPIEVHDMTSMEATIAACATIASYGEPAQRARITSLADAVRGGLLELLQTGRYIDDAN